VSCLRLVAFGLLAVLVGIVLLWFAGPLRPILNYDTAGLSPTPVERAVSLTFPDEFLWHVTEPGAVGKNVSLGAVALPLLLIAVILYFRLPRTRRAAGFWLAVSLPPLILTAGGSITLGSTSIPLPYTVLHTLFGGMLRYPERFAPVFLIPAALFSFRILTLYTANRPNPRLALTSALLFLVLADSRLYASVAIQPQPRDYDFYHAMGREPYDYVVLEVPTGGSSGEGLVGETSYSVLEFYGITHGKRMVNGHISRVNVLRYWYMRTDDTMLAWLGQRRFLEPEVVESQLRDRIFNWPIGYIVVHQDLIGRDGPTNQEIVGYFNTLPDLLCPVWVESDTVVYRTAWHPDGCPPRSPPETEPGVYTNDIGSTGDERFIGWGWHWPEPVAGLTLRWTGEYPQTQIFVDLPPGNYTLSLAAQSFWENRRLTVLVNGQPLDDPIIVTPDSLHEFTFAVPADLIGDGQHITLTLDYDAVIVPAEVGQSADPRRLAIAVDWLRFTRLSAP
jgi:hypothetical protein